jgi:FHS family L-fucose permease-like MFS transporter
LNPGTSPKPAASVAPNKKQYYQSIAIIGLLFFIFGFLTWLNATLIPFLKLACELPSRAQALLVTFAFYLAYFFLAIPSSFILEKTGFKKGMSLSVLVMAAGALLFIPAALQRSFNLFLVGLFVEAAGLALAQTAANPFISVVGPIESAARRISIMGICNKVAGALSPLILSAIVLRGAGALERRLEDIGDEQVRDQVLQTLANRAIAPYAVMAAVLVLLALVIRLSPLPEPEDGARGERVRLLGILEFPHLLLGVVCIFLYVGAEVMAGDVIGPYGQDLGMSLDETKNFSTYTLASMVLGYILGILLIPKVIRQETALKLSALVGIAFTMAAYVIKGRHSVELIALMGLANALMWPAIFPMAIAGLGRYTKLGSALLIMGVVGGGVVPQVYSRVLMQRMHFPPHRAFVAIMLGCYAYILFYAVVGHRVGRRRAS